MTETVFHSFFLIFTGAAIIATLAIYGRQPLLVAYIALGAIIGPYGIGWVQDIDQLSEMAEIGIIFLLFLLGLDMQPQALMNVFRQATLTTLFSSILFASIGYIIAYLFGFNGMECSIIGLAMMFSSTIIGIKLLPTTILHHRHSGDMMVGLLLTQDFIAIFVLLVLLSGEGGQVDMLQIGKSLLALPILILLAVGFVRYVLLKLVMRFDRIDEYIFLLSIGWCMGLAAVAEVVGLSHEIGAFLAGITLATSPISQHIALKLKPLRDFFLIVFFFSLGASFNLGLLPEIALAAAVLGVVMLGLKPLTFRVLLGRQSENPTLAWDIGCRLGQISEFSLLIAYVASDASMIGDNASHLIQATAILTFLVSSYIVVFNFPTPIAVSDKLRRD